MRRERFFLIFQNKTILTFFSSGNVTAKDNCNISATTHSVLLTSAEKVTVSVLYWYERLPFSFYWGRDLKKDLGPIFFFFFLWLFLPFCLSKKISVPFFFFFCGCFSSPSLEVVASILHNVPNITHFWSSNFC
jgi:hypothetical protein